MDLYKSAGVDLGAGYQSVELIKKHAQRTVRQGVLGGIGGFGGLFDLGLLNLKEPILVSGTDGVGTKLKLAFDLNRHDTIGIDCVAMCVNDVLVQGALPLFFLDYLAVGKNNPLQIEQIVKGIADGCVAANCALIGGETAEMPSLYQENEYDVAGFCVGVVEKSKLISGQNIKPNDVIVGIDSSGFHSNGFSLIRKIIKDKTLDLNKIYPDFSQTLGEILLMPTQIYVKAIAHLLSQDLEIKAMSHITGGGFYENMPRMLPQNVGAVVDTNTWEMPQIMRFFQEIADISQQQMFNIFNCGIGFMLVIDPKDTEQCLEQINVFHKARVVGKIVEKTGIQIH